MTAARPQRLAFGTAWVLAMLCGCHGTPPQQRSDAAMESTPDDAAAARLIATARCGECHRKMMAEWRVSSHARAARSPIYRATRALGDGVGCDRCHAPLAIWTTADDPLPGEGVACDVCHSVRRVEVRHVGAGFRLELDDNIRYGPLCDAVDHYFHRMGCSTLHREALLCAACHLYYQPSTADRPELPIFTEYDEWRESHHSADGLACQGCHMPGDAAEVAVGSPSRADVPHHGFLGRDGRLRQRALAGRVELVQSATLDITVTLRNVGAGHKVPTGLPGRQVVLRLMVLDAGGQELARHERTYARTLVDVAGREVFFPAAKRLGSDNRLAPGEARIERFSLPPVARGRLVVDVRWRRFSPALAVALPAAGTEEVALLAGELALDGTRRVSRRVDLRAAAPR